MKDKLRDGLITVGIIVGLILALAVIVVIFYYFNKLTKSLESNLAPLGNYLKSLLLSGRIAVSPYWVVFEFSAGFGIFIFLLFKWFSQNYNPQGSQYSSTHAWVDPSDGHQVMSASIKQVYEHEHGAGSWQKKVEEERKNIVVLGTVCSCLLLIVILAFKTQSMLLIIEGGGIAVLFNLLAKKVSRVSQMKQDESISLFDSFLGRIVVYLIIITFIISWFWIGPILYIIFMPAPPHIIVVVYLCCHLLIIGVSLGGLLIYLLSSIFGFIKRRFR